MQLHDPNCAESRSGQISFCHGELQLIHIALGRDYVNSFSTGFDITLQSALPSNIYATGFPPFPKNLCTKKMISLCQSYLDHTFFDFDLKRLPKLYFCKDEAAITLC